MNTGNIIMAALVAVIIIVYIIIILSNKQKKELKKLLNEFAAQNNCTVKQQEICEDLIFAFDESKSNILFCKKLKDTIIKKIIYLPDYQFCKLVNNMKTVKDQHIMQEITDLVQLSFIPKDKNKATAVLELFNSDKQEKHPYSILLVAEKWKELINQRLQN